MRTYHINSCPFVKGFVESSTKAETEISILRQMVEFNFIERSLVSILDEYGADYIIHYTIDECWVRYYLSVDPLYMALYKLAEGRYCFEDDSTDYDESLWIGK